MVQIPYHQSQSCWVYSIKYIKGQKKKLLPHSLWIICERYMTGLLDTNLPQQCKGWKTGRCTESHHTGWAGRCTMHCGQLTHRHMARKQLWFIHRLFTSTGSYWWTGHGAHCSISRLYHGLGVKPSLDCVVEHQSSKTHPLLQYSKHDLREQLTHLACVLACSLLLSLSLSLSLTHTHTHTHIIFTFPLVN